MEPVSFQNATNLLASAWPCTCTHTMLEHYLFFLAGTRASGGRGQSHLRLGFQLIWQSQTP